MDQSLVSILEISPTSCDSCGTWFGSSLKADSHDSGLLRSILGCDSFSAVIGIFLRVFVDLTSGLGYW